MLESSATVSSSECAPRDRKILAFPKLLHHLSREKELKTGVSTVCEAGRGGCK